MVLNIELMITYILSNFNSVFLSCFAVIWLIYHLLRHRRTHWYRVCIKHLQCHRHSVLLKIRFLDIAAVYTYLSEIKMAEFLPLKREVYMFNQGKILLWVLNQAPKELLFPQENQIVVKETTSKLREIHRL